MHSIKAKHAVYSHPPFVQWPSQEIHLTTDGKLCLRRPLDAGFLAATLCLILRERIMIIYGSKMYGAKDVVHGHGVCEHCGKYAKHKSYTGSKWGHLYFIPLIPAGGKMRVLKECSKCNMGNHIAAAKVPELHRSLQRGVEACLAAAAAGDHEYTDPETGEPNGTAPFLADAVDLLYTLGFRAEVPPILEALESSGAVFEYGAAKAVYAEMNGHPDEAMQALIAAAEANPESAYAPFALGQLHLRFGRPEEGLKELQFANQIVGNDPTILLEMTAPLETLKRYDELCDVLEQCMEMVPELESDKQFMKYYKKYSKKALKAAR